MDLKFEDVPLPEPRAPRRFYDFEKWPVKASVAFPKEEGEKILRAAHGFARKHEGMKFVSRKQDDGALRIWRAA